MKKIFFLMLAAMLMCSVPQANAQFLRNLVDKAADAARKGVDKAREAQSGREQNSNQEEVAEEAASVVAGWTCPECGHQGNTGKFCGECGAKQPSADAAAGWICPECGKTGNTGKFCDECGAKRPGAQAAAPAPQKKTIATEYSKSDFVPGDEVFFEDLVEGEQIGEFPSKWDLLEGEAETAKINGKTCISLAAEKTTTIEPLMKNQKSYLPDVFTLEFDFYRGKTESSMGYIVSTTCDTEIGYAFDIVISGQHSTELGGSISYSTPSGDRRQAELSYSCEGDTWNHFALSFNKRALKVYINGKRVANIPNCEKPSRFNIQQYSWGGFDDSGTNAITNIRLAKGAVPLYDRLMSDGKIITYAITFETGKADLKPESEVEINRIAKLMQENPNLSFEVQGHCDATGSDKVNDPLSQKRAEAIVAALVEKGIASARLTAIGKGSRSPIASNSTDEGRAKNRRVEFVKK